MLVARLVQMKKCEAMAKSRRATYPRGLRTMLVHLPSGSFVLIESVIFLVGGSKGEVAQRGREKSHAMNI